MMKGRILLSMVILVCTGSLFAEDAIGAIATCKLASGVTFGAKSKDCSDAAQQKACDKYRAKSKLGPSTPIADKCKVFTDVDTFTDALEEAAKLRKDPQAAAITQQVAKPGKLPSAVTCTLKTPKEGRKSFVTLAGTCATAQKSCDTYKDVPFLGPSTSTACKPFGSQDELISWVKISTANGSFPGLGGGVTTCKTRAQGIEFRERSKNCTPESQQQICLTGKGIADPITCTEYPTDRQIHEEVAKRPKKYGLECQMNVGGIAYRVIAPECGSDAINKELCDPRDGKVTSCKEFKDWKKLQEWTKVFINEATISCRVNSAPDVVYAIPGRDCSPESQKKTCGQFATPLYKKCFLTDVEELKRKAAEKNK